MVEGFNLLFKNIDPWIYFRFLQIFLFRIGFSELLRKLNCLANVEDVRWGTLADATCVCVCVKYRERLRLDVCLFWLKRSNYFELFLFVDNKMRQVVRKRRADCFMDASQNVLKYLFRKNSQLIRKWCAYSMRSTSSVRADQNFQLHPFLKTLKQQWCDSTKRKILTALDAVAWVYRIYDYIICNKKKHQERAVIVNFGVIPGLITSLLQTINPSMSG